jgi:hypothetical protein
LSGLAGSAVVAFLVVLSGTVIASWLAVGLRQILRRRPLRARSKWTCLWVGALSGVGYYVTMWRLLRLAAPSVFLTGWWTWLILGAVVASMALVKPAAASRE